MPRLLWCVSTRAAVLASLIVLVTVTAGSRTIFAQILDTEVAADSELQLLERADAGAYQRYLITLSSGASGALLATNKDGNTTTREVPAAEYVALWRELLNNDLETLVNAAPEQAAPDQSRFAVRYRAGARSGEFSVYGVDSLSDVRYRAIVRAVLAFAAKYSS